jgi:hypothetical protein
MREFVLYGLDESGAVRSTERFAGIAETEMRQIAGKRLETYARVEVWDGSICVIRLNRRKPG